MQKLLRPATLLLLTLALTMTLTGCQTVKLISGDKAVVRMPQGKPYTPTIDGWFVPDARMNDIMNALDKARIKGQ